LAADGGQAEEKRARRGVVAFVDGQRETPSDKPTASLEQVDLPHDFAPVFAIEFLGFSVFQTPGDRQGNQHRHSHDAGNGPGGHGFVASQSGAKG
jgi:hypothetical protein